MTWPTPAGALAILALALGAPAHAAEPAIPAGRYTSDPAHTSLTFRISHLGFSRFTARFTRVAAVLDLDPADPAAATVKASIDPLSLATDYPFDDMDFDAYLAGPDWLDAAQFPAITFTSTAVATTGPTTARITGDLALHGVTRPVVLEATFNGGYAGHPLDPGGSRIGFSAHGTIERSDFGITTGLPPAGSTFGVGDTIELFIETELLRPRPPGEAP
ncbi:MAG: YceI family protein [Geminicoccaceae bacterium]